MGVDFFRSQFEQMTPDRHVCWRPYDERVEVDDDDAVPHSFLHDLPHICLQQRQFWFAQVTLALLLYSRFASLLFITYVGLFIFMYLQVPLVFYQLVEHYYPGRVMRQFGMRQPFPVPDPISKDKWYELHKELATTSGKNWRTVHADYVTRLEAMGDRIPDELQSYAFDTYDQTYRSWYQEYCAFTVYLHGQITEMNTKPLHVRRDTVSDEYGFIPCAGPAAQIVSL